MATMNESGRPCKIFLLGSWFWPPLDEVIVNIDKELSIMGLLMMLLDDDEFGLISVDEDEPFKWFPTPTGVTLLCPLILFVKLDAEKEAGATCCWLPWLFNGFP